MKLFPDVVLPLAKSEYEKALAELIAVHGPNVAKPAPIITINAVASRLWNEAQRDPDILRQVVYLQQHGVPEGQSGGDDGMTTPYDDARYDDELE
jgi:hypothetical protein